MKTLLLTSLLLSLAPPLPVAPTNIVSHVMAKRQNYLPSWPPVQYVVWFWTPSTNTDIAMYAFYMATNPAGPWNYVNVTKNCFYIVPISQYPVQFPGVRSINKEGFASPIVL